MDLSKKEYVKVLANTEKGLSLEYVPSGQIITMSWSYFNRLPRAEALKILGIS